MPYSPGWENIRVAYKKGQEGMARPPVSAKNAATRAFMAFNLASFTIGAEAANVINVAVQLKDARGNNVTGVKHLRCYLATTAAGVALTGTAPTSTVAVGTNGVITNVPVADKMFDVITDASGRFDLNITQTAAPVTYYLIVQIPDGSVVASGAITYA